MTCNNGEFWEMGGETLPPECVLIGKFVTKSTTVHATKQSIRIFLTPPPHQIVCLFVTQDDLQ